jgi:hypothetical protein
MKKYLLALLIPISFGYSSQSSIKSGLIDDNKKGIFTNKNIDNHYDDSKISIQDTNLYDKEFLKDLKQISSQFTKLRIIDDKIIITQNQKKDTLTFPHELPLNVTISYSTEKNKKTYVLNLKRLSYTKISYEFKIDNKIIKTGLAILSGGLILGADSGEENGFGYFQNAYLDKTDCWTYLGIEQLNGDRVKISIKCEKDKSNSFNDIPILRKKTPHNTVYNP